MYRATLPLCKSSNGSRNWQQQQQQQAESTSFDQRRSYSIATTTIKTTFASCNGRRARGRRATLGNNVSLRLGCCCGFLCRPSIVFHIVRKISRRQLKRCLNEQTRERRRRKRNKFYTHKQKHSALCCSQSACPSGLFNQRQRRQQQQVSAASQRFLVKQSTERRGALLADDDDDCIMSAGEASPRLKRLQRGLEVQRKREQLRGKQGEFRAARFDSISNARHDDDSQQGTAPAGNGTKSGALKRRMLVSESEREAPRERCLFEFARCGAGLIAGQVGRNSSLNSSRATEQKGKRSRGNECSFGF